MLILYIGTYILMILTTFIAIGEIYGKFDIIIIFYSLIAYPNDQRWRLIVLHVKTSTMRVCAARPRIHVLMTPKTNKFATAPQIQ